jgi:hypothetical protein
MKAKLTPTFVQNATAEPGAERTVYWDETMPGFGLVCTKAGHRSFVHQYRKAQVAADDLSAYIDINYCFCCIISDRFQLSSI